jgi:putative MATE family efflux protein
MTEGRILPTILKFMIPLLIGNVIQQLYNMADTVIVGRCLGANALAAVGSTGTIMFLVVGFVQGLTAGFTVLTSQCYGAHEYERAKRSVQNGILLSVAVAIVVTFVSAASMRPLLRLMNTPDEIFQMAYTYIIIICLGSAATVFNNLFSSFLRAVGNSIMPLWFLIFSACLNVALDLIFIIAFGTGVGGAAAATVIAQGISAALCYIYIRRKMPVLWPEKFSFSLNKADTNHQLKIGLPMALQFAITASGTMIMQAAINICGAAAVAAYTAASKIGSLLMQGMISMGQAMATYCGQNYGKGDFYRITTGVKQAAFAEIIYSIGAAALGLLLLSPALSLFFSADTDMSEIYPMALIYMRMSVAFYIPLSMIFLFRNAMQGCGYSILPMLGGVVELVARLAVAAAAIHLKSYTLAVFCDPAAWIAAGVFLTFSYFHVRKDMRKHMEI